MPEPGVPGTGGTRGGTPIDPQFLTDQLTPFQPEGKILPTHYYCTPKLFYLPASLEHLRTFWFLFITDINLLASVPCEQKKFLALNLSKKQRFDICFKTNRLKSKYEKAVKVPCLTSRNIPMNYDFVYEY